MLIHALISSVRTSPEPSILLILDRLDEVFAYFIRRRLRIPMLTQHHLAQLLLIPIVHAILLLVLLLLLSTICVQTLLLCLALDRQIVTKLALPTLVAVAFFVELAEDCLWIDTEGHLLDLYGLEEVGDFAACVLGGLLFLFTLELFGFLLLLVGSLCGRDLSLDLFDLFLSSTTFFLWKRVLVWGYMEEIEGRRWIAGWVTPLENWILEI